MAQSSMVSSSVWRVWASLVCLGVASTVLPEERCAAQSSRLDVRPREMATGTRTTQAGLQHLESVDAYVYVPQQSVGTQRVPLVVFPYGGGQQAMDVIENQTQLAEQYGMILLAPNNLGTSVVDQAIQQVLREYAIDPDNIAVVGMSNGADWAYTVGHANLDVFSRVVVLSSVLQFRGSGRENEGDYPRNDRAQFFVSVGMYEDTTMFQSLLTLVQQLRAQKHTVEHVIGLRAHVERYEDYDYVWHWLQTSWAGATPHPDTEAVPVLTAEALAKMVIFWARFAREPDSIQTAAHRMRQQPIAIAMGQQQVTVLRPDMAALATQYPSVAADLEKAGLTAKQHEAYWAAILSAKLTQWAGRAAGTVPATSTLGKNVAFIGAHWNEVNTLEVRNIWTPQSGWPATHPAPED